jgi:hypothetical protein
LYQKKRFEWEPKLNLIFEEKLSFARLLIKKNVQKLKTIEFVVCKIASLWIITEKFIISIHPMIVFKYKALNIYIL